MHPVEQQQTVESLERAFPPAAYDSMEGMAPLAVNCGGNQILLQIYFSIVSIK
jgi:hypothetical protein